MALEPPTYIVSLQNNIRGRPISWEGAVRARTITDNDLRKIKSIDKVRKEQRRQTIEGDLDGFCKFLLGGDGVQSIFQAAAKRQDIIQYLLVLTGDLIDGKSSNEIGIGRQNTDLEIDIPPLVSTLTKHTNPYKPFLSFLSQSSNPEDPIPLLTSAVLSNLISHALGASTKIPPYIEEAIPQLNTYLSTLAKSSDSGLQDIALQEYSALLRTKKSRELYWNQRQETLSPLIAILRAAAGAGRDTDSTLWSGAASIRTAASDTGLGGSVSIQLLYHVLMVIWQLSFEGSMVGKKLEEYVSRVTMSSALLTLVDRDEDIILLYSQLLRISPKEKVTRLLLATLSNLLSSNKSTLLQGAIRARLPSLLGNVRGRHLTDPDLLEDLDNLKSTMEEYSKSQTTFDEYASEVRSGHLEWSPPHRDATFWKENARKVVEENKGELPRKLAEIMGKNWDTDKQVLAIGCNDIACLVKEMPEKKGQLAKMGLKTRVMELMQADDESVRWESLRAVAEWMRYSFDS